VTLREQVYRADGGRCVACGARCDRNAGMWGWSVHHCLKQQWLKSRKAPERFLSSPQVCVLLCKRCHERHESRTAPVPFERLPLRVMQGAQEVGAWAEDLLRRYHPPTELDAA
jgi:hypothetical protein